MSPKKTTTATETPVAELHWIWSWAPFNLLRTVWKGYWEVTSSQTMLIDTFIAFLLLVGGLQALYYFAGGHNVSAPSPAPSPAPTMFAPICYGGPRRLTCLRHRQPFNAFLAGFIVTVGQFVLTSMIPLKPEPTNTSVVDAFAWRTCRTDTTYLVALRMQTQEQNKTEFPEVTPERYATRRPPANPHFRSSQVPAGLQDNY